MRGLTIFIGDIKNCSNKEAEIKRVEKELHHIKEKFVGTKNMSGYNKKKYVWKLIYIFMLGYDVDCGHSETINLINSTKFTEKATGYIATGIIFLK